MVELITYKWQDGDPPNDDTYRAIGTTIAKILTGTYYFTARGLGVPGQPKVWITMGSARTSIGSTALMGLLNEKLDEKLNTAGRQQEIANLPSEDVGLTRNKTFGQLVEELSRNITLSLFSSTRLWYVWVEAL